MTVTIMTQDDFDQLISSLFKMQSNLRIAHPVSSAAKSSQSVTLSLSLFRFNNQSSRLNSSKLSICLKDHSFQERAAQSCSYLSVSSHIFFFKTDSFM